MVMYQYSDILHPNYALLTGEVLVKKESNYNSKCPSVRNGEKVKRRLIFIL